MNIFNSKSFDIRVKLLIGLVILLMALLYIESNQMPSIINHNQLIAKDQVIE